MTHGIHHVTAFAGDPQRNVDFYSGVLGLRLVKKTVNFDDPGTYHLYFGDELGRPGTIMTFFPWRNSPQGRPGNGQVGATAFAIPQGALSFWLDRLQAHGVTPTTPTQRFGATVVSFTDPDGLPLELVTTTEPRPGEPWRLGGHAILGFHSVTLLEQDRARTHGVLVDVLGMTEVGREGSRTRYRMAGEGPGVLVDVLEQPDGRPGLQGVGTVHHVAWRTATKETQRQDRARVVDAGLHVTQVLDRNYFESIYFREPGGVLFEIATDPPGFTADEPAESLGSTLRLPGWLEPQREDLERRLPALTIKEAARA